MTPYEIEMALERVMANATANHVWLTVDELRSLSDDQRQLYAQVLHRQYGELLKSQEHFARFVESAKASGDIPPNMSIEQHAIASARSIAGTPLREYVKYQMEHWREQFPKPSYL